MVGGKGRGERGGGRGGGRGEWLGERGGEGGEGRGERGGGRGEGGEYERARQERRVGGDGREERLSLFLLLTVLII